MCDVASGACLDQAGIVYATPNGPNTTACSQADPCSIESAFAVASLNRDTIKLSPGEYVANITVTDKKVVVHGAGATLSASAGKALVANNRAKLRVIGMSIVNTGTGPSNGIGVECANAVDVPFVELDQVTLDTGSIPLNVLGCNATVTRSRIHSRHR